MPTSVVHLAPDWEDCKMDLEENAILISSTETFSGYMEGGIPTAIECEKEIKREVDCVNKTG